MRPAPFTVLPGFPALASVLLLVLLLPAAGQAPVITVQPHDQTVCPNGSVTFFVHAEGFPQLHFQWRRDGNNLGIGATSSDNDSLLTVANVQPLDAASTFDVIVSNAFGQTNSVGVAARAPDPWIWQQPLDQTFLQGGTIIFHVEACGLPPLSSFSYQWFSNDTRVVNSPRLSGATSNTLTILNAAPADSATYQVLIHNPAGAIYSDSVQCVVDAFPNFVLHPQPLLETCEGGTVTFQATASGSLPLQFQWHHDGTNVTTGVVSSGSNSFLTVANVSQLDTKGFDVQVSNPYGEKNSSTGHLAFPYPAPAFFLQPSNTVVPVGGTIRFESWACGEPSPLAYQWYQGATQLVDGPNIQGANANLLMIANAQTNNSDFYKVVVHDHFGFQHATSVVAQCFVGEPPTVGSLTSRVVRVRSNTTFNPTYTGSSRTYQWYRNDVPIPGPAGTGQNLVRNQVQRPVVGLYHVVVSNPAGTVTSEKAHLQVRLTLEGNTPVFYEEATDVLHSLTNAVPSVFTPPDTTVFHGVPLLFSTYNATAQPGEKARCSVWPSHSMWVLYRSPRSEQVKVSTEGSSFDTVVAVYAWDKEETHDPTEIACNDNGGADGRTSRLFFSATNNQEYYIAVDSGATRTGIVRLQVGDNIRKAQFDRANGSFRFEWAGAFWKNNILQDTTDLSPPTWVTRRFMPATNTDWIIGYTNNTALSDKQRFYSTTVAPVLP